MVGFVAEVKIKFELNFINIDIAVLNWRDL
jgi:hypothetical protein